MVKLHGKSLFSYKHVHDLTIYRVNINKTMDKKLKIMLAKLGKTLLKGRHFSATFIRLLVKIQRYELECKFS